MPRRIVLVLSALLVKLALLSSSSTAQTEAWMVDSITDTLYAVDLVVGTAAPRASTSFNGMTAPADLCWVEATRQLYAVDFAGGEVGTIDPLTGVFQLVATAQPATGWQGLAWDAVQRRFLLSNQDNRLYALDPQSGTTTVIGTMNANLIAALDIDAMGTLWGIEFFTGRLLHIDMSDASTTFVARLQAGAQGLAVDLAAGLIYIANSSSMALHRADTTLFIESIYAPFGSTVRAPKGFDIGGPACAGMISRSGVGCLDANGVPLRLEVEGAPCRALNIQFRLSGALQSPYFLAAGVSDQQWLGLPLPWLLHTAGAPGCSFYVSHDVIVGPLAPTTNLNLRIPTFPIVLGVRTHWQALIVDPSLPSVLPLASSDYLTIVIG